MHFQLQVCFCWARMLTSFAYLIIQIRYICSTDGCKFFEDSSTNSESRDEVLVIRRSDKTVRAVEMQTGQEK